MSKYEPRTYRNEVLHSNLVSFEVLEYETDLYVCADSNLYLETLTYIKKYREELTQYIQKNKLFQTSFQPIKQDEKASNIIKSMIKASTAAEVGPFAAVAGAIAEYIGKDILLHSSEVIVENGGDIFLSLKKDTTVGIFSGKASTTNNLGLIIKKEIMPIGICTSSGKIGHSKSFGNTDVTIIISKSTPVADAVATATGNIVKTSKDIKKGLNFASKTDGILGALIIIDNKIGAWGEIELTRT